MNRELLARVRDRIAEVGNEHCDMNFWVGGTACASGEPKCGTTACIAGWTVAVAKGALSSTDDTVWVERDASQLLGLPTIGSPLFFKNRWPEHYQYLAKSEGDAKGMLAVCDALLDGSLGFDADGSLVETEQT